MSVPLVGQKNNARIFGWILCCVSDRFLAQHLLTEINLEYLRFDRGVLVLCDWQVSLGFCGKIASGGTKQEYLLFDCSVFGLRIRQVLAQICKSSWNTVSSF